MKTAFDFLERMYLPKYMTLLSADYDKNSAVFDFNPVESQITIISDKYLTPRGVHIFVSQGVYCLIANKVENLSDITEGELEERGFEGRLKLVEFNQRFKKELSLKDILQGKLTLINSRNGKIPIVKMNFDIGNKGIVGSLTGIIAPRPMPQTNYDILRA